MADVFSKEKRSDVMSRIRSKDTKPEILVRHALHRLGHRYRLHDRKLPGRPDIVFPRQKVAVQVRGCFWHSHSCIDGHLPKTQKKYWSQKLMSNQRRDRLNAQRLRKLGWHLVIVWECKCTKQESLKKQVDQIASLL